MAPPTFCTSSLQDSVSQKNEGNEVDLQEGIVSPNTSKLVIADHLVTGHPQSVRDFPLLFNGE